MKKALSSFAGMAILLSGCGAVQPVVKEVLSNPAERVKCVYERNGRDFRWSCEVEGEGKIPIQDGTMPFLPGV
jgi:hypothetical protein